VCAARNINSFVNRALQGCLKGREWEQAKNRGCYFCNSIFVKKNEKRLCEKHVMTIFAVAHACRVLEKVNSMRCVSSLRHCMYICVPYAPMRIYLCIIAFVESSRTMFAERFLIRLWIMTTATERRSSLVLLFNYCCWYSDNQQQNEVMLYTN
jgi:hypothetical protein